MRQATPAPVPPRRAFLRDLGIGVIIILLVAVAEWSGWRTAGSDAAADAIMPHYRNVLVHPDGAEGLAFVNIDDATYDAWGEPLITPRDKLATLISHVVAGDPRVVVVDIDLSRRSDRLNRAAPAAGTPLHWADQALLKVLTRARPPIILVREFELGGSNPGCAEGYHRPSKSFLDVEVAAEPNLYWASPLFGQSDDLVIRRWRLFEHVCRDGKASILPSVQLLVLALLRDRPSVAQLDGAASGSDGSIPPAEASPITVNHEEVFSGTTSPGSRIFYTLPWDPPAAAPAEPADSHLRTVSGGPKVEVDGRRVNLLHITSAAAITEAGPSARPPSSHYRGRIVVIGASHYDTRDLHLTPLGLMPGAMILVNAIHSLLQHGVLSEPPRPLRLLPAFALVLVVAALFNVLQNAPATLLSFGLIASVTFLLSGFWLRHGLWLDATLPAFGLVLVKWAVTGRELLQYRHLGWRAFLHPRWHPHSLAGTGADDEVAALGDKAGAGASSDERRTTAALVLLLLLVTAPPLAAADVVVGYVHDFEPPSTAYEVRRTAADGSMQVLPVAIGLELLPGDRIVPRVGEGWVDLDLGERRVRVSGDRPFGVPTALAGPPTPLGNAWRALLARLGALLTVQRNQEARTRTVSLTTRGRAPLVMPLLADGSLVVTGRRALALAWQGGTPPYQVRVLTHGAALVAAEELPRPRYISPPLPLEPGGYATVVTDAKGARVDAHFEVVPAVRLPHAPEHQSLVALNPALATAVQAVWLATQDGGAWRYEAYLQLFEAGEHDSAIRLLADALAQGVPVP